MRIFAFLLLCISIAAYRSQETTPAPASTLCAAAIERPLDILVQSADGGNTWKDISRNLPEGLQINAVLFQDGEVFLGTENNGLYHSSNPEAGDWVQENVGGVLCNTAGIFPNEGIMNIFPGRSGLYITVFQGGFYRKQKDTGLWQPMGEALEDKTISSVAETPDGTIFVSCGRGIYKSTDDGASWQHVYSKTWASSVIAVGNTLVACIREGLLSSNDGGEHWDMMLRDEGAHYNTSAIGERIAAIRAGGGSWSVCNDRSPLMASADGGKSWQRMDGGVSGRRIYEIEQAGSYLFCSHSNGISRSADGGKTWELVRSFTSPEEKEYLSLTVSGQTVFALKRRAGC